KNEFISNISHDIKSPLSNIKGYVQLLENEAMDRTEKAKYMTIIHQEMSRLSNLTKQLLLLASLNRQEQLLKKEKFLVSEQLKEIIRSHQWSLEEKGLMVSYTLPEKTMIYGDPSMLYNVWENLFTNAIKYNEESGSIDVTVKEHDKSIEVHFEDTGIGWDEHIKERDVDRFFREDSYRNRKIEEIEHGMANVARILELHDCDTQL